MCLVEFFVFEETPVDSRTDFWFLTRVVRVLCGLIVVVALLLQSAEVEVPVSSVSAFGKMLGMSRTLPNQQSAQ